MFQYKDYPGGYAGEGPSFSNHLCFLPVIFPQLLVFSICVFQNKDFAQGVAALAKERSLWLSRSDHLIRAARHYEGAAQILIRHAVMTAKKVTVGYRNKKDSL